MKVWRSMLVAGHGGTAALLCGAPVTTGHGEAKRDALQHHGDRANTSMRPRRLEVLQQSMATAAAMEELRKRHTHGGAKRNTAYQWRGCGHCVVGKVEQSEVEL